MYFFVMESVRSKFSDRKMCIAQSALLYAVDSVLYSFAPFILMSFTNFAIIVKFMRAKCQNSSTEATSQALVKVATRGTAMVVTVSITFLFLTAPTAVGMALWNVTQLSYYNPVYRTFMNLAQYLNHSINGVLYIVVGTRFRKELLKIICGKERTEGFSVSNSGNDTRLTTMSVATS